MGFITSRSAVGADHGVFAEEVQPPPQIQAIGTGVVGLVGQFPWGPDDSIVQGGVAERLNTLAPMGMSRTGTGFMAMFGKSWPDLRVVRVLGSAAARAAVTIDTAADADCITVTAKCKGAAGNEIDIVVANATDGDANHFNLTAFVTNDDGTTTELFENLNVSGTGANVLDPDQQVTNSILLQSIAMVAAGRPENGTYSLSGGLDGTINSGRYIGTPGAADFGMALFEGDPEIRVVCSDDTGNTDRDAVSDALQAHAQLMGDRIAVINGNSGLSVSGVQAAVAGNRSARVVWADPWPYQYDSAGVERLVSPAPWAASVIANLSPSTSPAWKGDPVKALLSGVTRTETSRQAVKKTLTLAGVMTMIKHEGSFVYEAGVLTIAPATKAKRNISRTRMGDYIAVSLTNSLGSYVDAPNVPVLQNEIVAATERFMNDLKGNVSTNPIGLPHVLDWWWGDFAASNTQQQLANGDFTLPLNVQTSSPMERIFLSIQFGENVFRVVNVAA